MIHLHDEERIRRLLDPDLVIAAIEAGFGRLYNNFVMPKRMPMELPESRVVLLMPCYDRTGTMVGVKFVTVKTAATGGSVRASYQFVSADTGEAELIMPANYLTEIRTAATSAVATKYLAREEVKTLGIFGTGRQAWAHATVLPRIRRFTQMLVCGRSPRRAADFAKRASGEIGLPVQAVDATTCAAESDVICTCTTARVPLFDGNRIRSGTHLNLVGAFRPADREVDDSTVQRARVVVDTYEGALAEGGDLLIPINNGSITRSHVGADLHELVSGKRRVRQTPDDITLFKSVGCALEDFVTAELIRAQLSADAPVHSRHEPHL